MLWKILWLLVGLFASKPIFADQIQARCSDDLITTAVQGQGRNAWSRKCGYIKVSDEEYLNQNGMYVVFSDAKSLPASVDAECVAGARVLAFCAVGCYAPEQQLLFDGVWQGIAGAPNIEDIQVNALASYSPRFGATFSSQPIAHFTRGVENGDLVVMDLSNDRRLRVTPDHPLVDKDGKMVPARSLRAGDRLLGIDGVVEIKDLGRQSYVGDVWNVRPVAADKLANVLVVEGVFTGSHRFQYDWAKDAFRLFLRNPKVWQP